MDFEVPYKLPIDPKEWNICVVMPTRNEADTLEDIVDELRTSFANNGLKPPKIIISDDSHDNTRAIAHKLGVNVVIGEGKGLGYAMQKGLRAALKLDPTVILAMDADGQSDPSEIMKFLMPLAEDVADMVIGSRFQEKGLVDYDYRWINRMGTIILVRILKELTGLPLTDSHGGLRAFRPEVVRSIEVMGTHTYVQESIIDAHAKGYRILEVPSKWRRRLKGSSKVVGSITKYIMYTLPMLIIRSGAHVRWLYGVATFLVLFALAFFASVVIEAHFVLANIYLRIPALIFIAMMIMIATQIFTLGFLAEMISIIKLRVDRLNANDNN